MTHDGPDLSLLMHHLAACPHDFLMEPAMGKEAGVDTLALCRDTLRAVCAAPLSPAGEKAVKLSPGRDYRVAVQIGCWLFSHRVFDGREDLLAGMRRFFEETLKEISPHVKPENWPRDMERCEEFCRLALMACELIPRDESDRQAFERFESVSTLKRKNILSRTAASCQRMKALRQKMAEQAAREAANVYGRE